MAKFKIGQSRLSRIEYLEPRWLLSASPTLASLADITLAAGAPLHIALDAADADGDELSFSISISNENITGGSLSYEVPEGNRSMLISTNYGDMIFELFEQRAPDTTARIIELAESDFYDGLIFHRVTEYSTGIPFVIQGGDPDGDGTGGSGVDFDDEFHPTLLHTSAGVLSMAKSNDDTNDSQFFITGSSARHLDFNHSVFGFQTEGEDVREAIEQVAVDANDKPLTDVVMESVEIFYDTENGTLMLSAPEGASGTADVTVTVDDGNGGTYSRTFTVTVAADSDASANSPPYLGDIADVSTTVDTPVSFNISAFDLEGDDIYYAGLVNPTNDNITIDVDADTGQVTVTPSGGITGVYGLVIGVRAYSGGDWDTQCVPLLINPDAPTSINLLSSSDTGSSSSDDITNLNNTPGNTMTFLVGGTESGAVVSLFADGQLIGQALAGGSTTSITTNASMALADGAHVFTASQTLQDVDLDVGTRSETVDLESGLSAPLSVTIDTVAPVFTSTAPITAMPGVLYQYQAAAGAGVVFRLDSGPSGMSISSSGLVSWTPTSQHSAQQSVVLIATDTAGNETSQTFTLQLQPGPEVEPVADQSVDEGGTVSFTVSATPQDDDGPLTFSLDSGAPAGATINAESGHFAWATDEADGPGQYTVNIRVTAPSGACHVETVVITVGEVNIGPELADIGDIDAAEGQLIDIMATATDADLPANTLSYSLVGDVPAGAAIDADSGRLTWRPDESQGGQSFMITVRVADGNGGSDQKSFNVSVAETDDAPKIEPIDNRIVMTGETLSVTVSAFDPDSPANSIRYEIASDAPAGLTIDPDSGLISWDVPEDYSSGTFDVVVRATEILPDQSAGLSTTAVLRITVTPAVSAWLAFDRVLDDSDTDSGVADDGETFDPTTIARELATREAAEALSSAARSSGGTLRFLSSSTPSAGVDTMQTLGFELSVSGSGGRHLTADTQSEGDVEGKPAEGENIDAEKLDPQTINLPTSSRETAGEDKTVADDGEYVESDAQPQPPQMAQAVDAAMAGFDEIEETGEADDS